MHLHLEQMFNAFLRRPSARSRRCSMFRRGLGGRPIVSEGLKSCRVWLRNTSARTMGFGTARKICIRTGGCPWPAGAPRRANKAAAGSRFSQAAEGRRRIRHAMYSHLAQIPKLDSDCRLAKPTTNQRRSACARLTSPTFRSPNMSTTIQSSIALPSVPKGYKAPSFSPLSGKLTTLQQLLSSPRQKTHACRAPSLSSFDLATLPRWSRFPLARSSYPQPAFLRRG